MPPASRRNLWRLPYPALAGALMVLFAACAGAPAGEMLPGPEPVRVIEVIDGDTVLVRARIWLGQEVAIRVRLGGIDAPELRGRCDGERAGAERARDFLRARLAAGGAHLAGIRYGKFAGRVVARLIDATGTDLSAALVEAGLARPYDGGRRVPWCPAQGAER